MQSIADEARFHRALEQGILLERDELSYRLQVPSAETPRLVEQLLGCCRIADLHVRAPSLESVVRKFFAAESARSCNAA